MASIPLEELDPNQGLELFDLRAERGLGDEAGLCGAAKVERVCEGYEVFELAEGRSHC